MIILTFVILILIILILNFDGGDKDDNDDDMDADDLLRKYDNLRRRPIPKPRPQKYEDKLLHRYDRLKLKTDESDLLRKFDKLKKPVFHDITPSPPPPLKRKDYSDDEESLILLGPPSSISQPPPRPDILQTNFNRPTTNLIDKANNVTEIVPKNKKEELDKLDLHLSTQLSKLFPEVEDSKKIIDDKNDEKINELSILQKFCPKQLNIFEVPKQLNIFEKGENMEFENRVTSIGFSTDSIQFLDFLQSNFCQEILIQNKLKIHIETENIFFNNLDTNQSI